MHFVLCFLASTCRSESQFIQDMVKEIQKMLHRPVLNVASNLIGMDSRVKDIDLWLQDELNNVGIATINGIGGIGKTAIAKTVYNLNFERFQGSSFLSNVRDSLKEPNGLARLQRQLLSNILKGKMNEIYNVEEGTVRIKDAICCRKVLIVLDDVDHMDQIDAIIGRREWFYPGSKIIITTRHARLLKAHEVCEKFAAKELDNDESLQLFCWHAFGKIQPIEGYEECSRKVVRLCGGLPLALQVLGSSLSGSGTEVWEDAIHKLEEIPDSRIQNVLKISYESLQDDHDKNLFLDIACFFIGKYRGYIVGVLDGCGFYTKIGIHNLADRCLLTIERNKVMMHQLLRDMGREIVRQESTDNPGKRSRIWHHKEAFTVLEEKTGTETIRGLTLDVHKLMEDKSDKTIVCVKHTKRLLCQDSLDQFVTGNCLKRRCLGLFSWQSNSSLLTSMSCLETRTFENLQKLKLLQLNYVKLNGDYSKLPKNLIWLCSHGFPLTSMPTNFHLKKLVALDMRYSSLKHVWHGTMFLAELKFLNLSHSHSLVRTPDFSGLPSLERLNLKDCTKLVRVDESIGSLQRLAFLSLKDCKNLRKIPRTIDMLKSLEELILSGCSKLDELPKDLEKIESLRKLHADGVVINQSHFTGSYLQIISLLPTKVWHSTFLSWLSPKKAPGSTNLSMLLPSSLAFLSLQNCNLSDDAFLNVPSSLPSFLSLNLSGNPLQSLPKSLSCLTMLRLLSLQSCTELRSLPELPMNLQTLNLFNCTSLERVISPSKLPELFNVIIIHCDKLVEIEGLFKLESINNIDRAILGGFGLSNLQPFGSVEVSLYNFISRGLLKTPIQVLHECGVISIFLPRSELPSRCNLRSMESLISFRVPLLDGHKIVGLNVCVLYTLQNDPEYLFVAPNYIKISNKTKRMSWMYTPICLAIPEGKGKEMLWLSHWRLGEELEIGDQIDISTVMGPTLQVKVWGIFFVYEPSEDKERATPSNVPRNSPWFQTFTLAEAGADECFLCHHTCSSLQHSLGLLDEHVPISWFFGRSILLKQRICPLCKVVEKTAKKDFVTDPSNHLEGTRRDYT